MGVCFSKLMFSKTEETPSPNCMGEEGAGAGAGVRQSTPPVPGRGAGEGRRMVARRAASPGGRGGEACRKE